MPARQILDVGCGIKKFPGSTGIDRNTDTAADIIWDLDQFPWPVEPNSYDEARLIHVIEHVGDVIATMEELHRILKPGGQIILETPHYTDFSSWCDPTHRWHLNSFSFRYFGVDNAGFGYYSRARLRQGELTAGDIAFSSFTRPTELPADATPIDLAAWTIAARVILNLDETLTKN